MDKISSGASFAGIAKREGYGALRRRIDIGCAVARSHCKLRFGSVKHAPRTVPEILGMAVPSCALPADRLRHVFWLSKGSRGFVRPFRSDHQVFQRRFREI